jgi:pimeloyl-ACP methyl ester carboxylesterase
MPRIKVGELYLYYEIHGDGEPLVLIPGFRTGMWLWFRQVLLFDVDDKLKFVGHFYRSGFQPSDPARTLRKVTARASALVS